MTRLLAGALAALLATSADARTLIANANGYTLDAKGELQRFGAILIGDDGKVAATYAKGAAEPKLGAGDFRLDAGGKTLLPGLIDAHGHVMGLGQQALTVDLSETTSLDEALAKVRDYAAANPRARWIVGRGWNQVSWKLGRFPTAAELDRAVSDRPALLARVDGHAVWANSAAIRASGVTAATKDPAGGRIERDAKGAPAGVFVDTAEYLVAKAMPPRSGLQLEADLAKSLEIMASVGLTGVHDAGIDPATWNLYRRFGDEGRLTVRVYAMAGGMEALDAIAPVKPVPWLYDDRLTLRAVKLYADGALGSRGAYLKAPYSDDPKNRGLKLIEDSRLQNWISRASFTGIQAAVHAIGDAANAEVLDAFELNLPTYGDKLRHRIEHAQVIDPADLPRFAKLGVIASVQPTHATSDKAMAADRVGEARLTGAYAWKTLLDSGARIAGGSDFPVEPPNPFYGLHAAVTRQDRQGQPLGGWRPQEALTLKQAFAAFTRDAAWAGHMEDKVGTLEPGKWADLILVDRDPFAIAPGELWQVQVDETWLAGKRVFVRK
ncbi:MAG: amidohydrolase [Alphaproteobacteria bacterium]|nr:amidohydrolase [Alphaproteobacteria bacterium]